MYYEWLLVAYNQKLVFYLPKKNKNPGLCALQTLSLNCVCVLTSAQALQDPGVYGVIQSGDHKGRTCVVKWIKLNSTSDDVEVSQ